MNRFITKAYVGTVIAAGAVLLVTSAPREIANPTLALTFLAAMILVSLFKLRLPLGHGQSTLSMAYVIDFVVLITAGADLAMIVAAAGVIVQCTARVRRRQPWYRAAFSVATVAMAVKTAGWTWAALGGSIASPSVEATLIPLAAAATLYFAVNTGLVAGAIALSSGASFGRFWRRAFACAAPGYVAAAVVMASVPVLLSSQASVLLPFAAVPMLFGYAAYASWFRQVADRVPAPALT